jgi:hypothetical protein
VPACSSAPAPFAANLVHSTVATADEDVVFFTAKDMSPSIIGMAADGTMAGLRVDPFPR